MRIQAYSVAVFFSLFSLLLSAQREIKGRVFDSESGEPLAFVAIAEAGNTNGTYSDIDGYFKLSAISEKSSLTFIYTGYENYTVRVDQNTEWAIKLHPKDLVMQEVVILPGENPAERIIRKTIDNKEANNPEGDVSFTYDSYNKLVFTPDLDSTFFDDTLAYSMLSKDDKEMADLFRKQHVMLMESVSQRKYLPPEKSEETIIATRVSGLSNPDFALLATQLQSFSIYGESVEVMDISYLSPLANGAISKYLFILEDTTLIDADTVFTISFQPRKGKNFKGLKGQLYINTHGYAVQNVITEPAENKDSFTIKIQQQYQLTQGGWFPEQLNSFIRFPSLAIGGWTLKAIGRSYIQNIQFGSAMKRRDFSPVVLRMDEDAKNQPDSVWAKYRVRPLDKRELNTYHYMDSLGKAENFDRGLLVLGMITTGKLPIGNVSLDLNRLIRYNDYEGWRFGAGVHTNDFLSKWFSIGGYYGYGLKDKQDKYGADLKVDFYRKRDGYFRFIYEHDIMETAGHQLDAATVGLFAGNAYPLFISRMDSYEKKEVQLNGRVVGNITANLFANTQFIKPYQGIAYQTYSSEGLSLYGDEFFVTEAGVMVRYAPGEKLVLVGQREVRLRGRWPVFYLKVSDGVKGVLDGDYNYMRYDALVEKTFRIKNVGDFKVKMIGGLLDGNVPLSLLYNMRGSWKYVTTSNTFETMRVNEFQHSSFLSVHLRHNFHDLLFKRPKFAPEISLVHNMGWGQLINANRFTINAVAASRGYFESGIQFDRLYKAGLTSYGIGFFYHYGPYSSSAFKNNIAIKLSSFFG